MALAEHFLIKGIAHITGGGITENLPRVFPKGVRARVSRAAWSVPPIFDVMSRLGRVDREEMYRIFNMGLGLILVVPPDSVSGVLTRITALGGQGWQIGEIVSSTEEEPKIEYVD